MNLKCQFKTDKINNFSNIFATLKGEKNTLFHSFRFG